MPALSTCNLTASNRKAALIAHAWEGGDRIDRKNHTESGATETGYLQCKGGSAVSLGTFP